MLPGDAALAAFGIDQAHEDDAARAIRAACGVADVVARAVAPFETELRTPVSAAVGVATNELVSGEDGVRGAQVVASRPGSPAVRLPASLASTPTPSTSRRMPPPTSRSRPPGSDERGRFRVTQRPADHPLARPTGRAAFVNRDAERALLADALERATAERRPQVVTLLGPPGIGKSRLVREFTTSVPEGTVVAVGCCLSYGESTSVFALDAVVRALVGDDVATGLAQRLADVDAASRSPTASRSRSAPVVAVARARRSSGRSGGSSSGSPTTPRS